MADIKKIRLSGVTYNIVDEGALRTLDNTVTSGGTNAVKGSGIYDAITASSAAVLETVGQAGYQTSTDVQNAISGKADSSAVTEEISAAVSGKADSTAVAQDIAAAVSGKADTSALTVYADAVAYDSNSKEMKFYHGGTSGTEVYSFDASPFLIDGMVDNVEIKDVTISGESVTCLVITFNTDAGKQEIDIPISEIFDASNYYTKGDVDAALSAKADTSAVTYEISAAVSGKQDTLISGTNIKTINNQSILGDGNITIEQGTVDQTIVSGSTNAVAGGAVYDGLVEKQETLVSGTNIKTVGNTTVLGSGNIALMTASIGTGNDSETLIFDFA